MFLRSDPDRIQLVAALAFGGGYLMLRGFRMFRLRRKIEDLATSPIASAPQGLVEVRGRAFSLHHGQVVDCMGLPCVFVDYEISKGSGKSRRTLRKGREGGRFVIEDETGTVHVIATDAELHFKEELKHWSSVPEVHRKRLLDSGGDAFLLKPLGLGSLGHMDMDIKERKLLPGSPVYAIGVLRSRSREPEAEILDTMGTRRKVSPVGGIMKHPVHPLVLADAHEEELLRRIGSGTFKMVSGAVLITMAVGLGIVFYGGRLFP
jgi:hypothetical protein